MKLDMDLVRKLLLFCEEKIIFTTLGPAYLKIEDFAKHDQSLASFPKHVIQYHLKLMSERGLIERVPNHHDDTAATVKIGVGNLTWEGHEFLETVRDTAVWRETKEIAQKAGGFTLELLGDIAKGVIKTQIKRVSGVEI